MSLLFFDSFDHRNNCDTGQKLRSGSGALSTAFGQDGQGAGLASSNFTRYFYGWGDHPTFISGASVVFATGSAFYAQGGELSFGSAHGAQQEIKLYATAGGVLQVTRGSTLITGARYDPGLSDSAITPPGAVSPSTPATIEMKATLNQFGANTSGSVFVRVNGVLVIGVTSCQTRNSGNTGFNNFDYVSWWGNPSSDASVDNFWDCNGADSGIVGMPNNDFLGSLHIKVIYPKGNGASGSFLPTPTQANWLNVKENPLIGAATAPDTTNYNQSLTPEAKDTYDHDDLNLPGAIIYGVQAVPYVGLSHPGRSKGFAHLCRRGSNLIEGEKTGLTDGFTYMPKMYQSSPTDTTGFKTTPWTPAEVDAAEFGIIVKEI